MNRVRLSFDVRGEDAQQIQERAEAVVRDFIGLDRSEPLDRVSEMEIAIEGAPADGSTDAPLPSYNFIGHVHVRIKP